MTTTAEEVRQAIYDAHQARAGIALGADSAQALWESILHDRAARVRAEERCRRNFEATIKTLNEIADDANKRRTETPDRMQAEWYQGMHHGLTRAISVLEGRG